MQDILNYTPSILPPKIDINLEILNIGLACHNADWNWKNVNSPFIRIYYITEGSAKIIFNNKTHDLLPNHLYIIPAFTKHSYVCTSIFKHYYIHIYEEVFDSTTMTLDSWELPFEIKSNSLDDLLVRRLCEINPTMKLPESNPKSYDNNTNLINSIVKNKRRSLYNRIESKGIILQLISRFLQNGNAKRAVNDDRIHNSILYIRKNLNNNITLEELANKSCLSKEYYIHLFKKEMGVSPLQYINIKKIEKAQLLLTTDVISVKEISYMLAFNDFSYFIRLFKKHTGVSPSSYRKQSMQH